MLDTVGHGRLSFPTHFWVVYSENALRGDGKHVAAPDEGASCVDDAARAAVFYLNDFRDTRHAESLQMARNALDFVLQMQTPDGEFYNFVYADGTVNRDGETSRKSLKWWAARALWALGVGYSVYREVDPMFAAGLSGALRLTCRRLSEQKAHLYGRYRRVQDRDVPEWLMGDGADISAIALMGLLEYYSVTEDRLVRETVMKLCAGIAVLRRQDVREFPFGALLPWPECVNLWHSWGNRQATVLARAGRMFGRPEWIAIAERCATTHYLHLVLSGGPIEGMYPAVAEYPQIAYGAEVQSRTYLALYESTGKPIYRVLGGLSGGWLFGNNTTGLRVYDPATGKCFDGIDGPDNLSPNSGMESTVSALLALQHIEKHPTAVEYLDYRREQGIGWAQFEAEHAVHMSGGAAPVKEWEYGFQRFAGSGYLEMPPGASAVLRFRTPEPQSYTIHMASLKQPVRSASVSVDLDGKEFRTYRMVTPGSESFLAMDMLPGSHRLDAGRHELTMRADPSNDASVVIDCVLIRPDLEYGSFVSPDGDWLYIAKNWSSEEIRAVVRLPRTEPTVTVFDRSVEETSGDVQRLSDQDGLRIAVPPEGFAVIESRVD